MKASVTQNDELPPALRLLAILALFAILLAAVTLAPALAQEDPDTPDGKQFPDSPRAVAAGPDFKTIDDPLNGDYELFTVDDLLFARISKLPNLDSIQLNNTILETANETVSKVTFWPVDAAPCVMTNNQRNPQNTLIGRFFDLPYDVHVTLGPTNMASGIDCSAPSGTPNMGLYIINLKNNTTNTSKFSMSAVQTAMAMNDFNQDGYEDLFIMSNNEVLVATAEDVTDINQAMRLGAPTVLPSENFAPRYDPATGDFNADRLKDVAWIGNDYTVHFATVCPGPVPDTICAGKEELDVLLDPLQSQNVPIVVTAANAEEGCTKDAQALTTGHFSDAAAEGLLVFDCRFESSDEAVINSAWYQFSSNWNMIGGVPIDQIEIDVNDYPYTTFAQAGRLHWFGNYDQAVFAIGSNQVCSGSNVRTLETVGVITFDDNDMSADMTVGKAGVCTYTVDNLGPWVNGLAIGRFAAIADDTTNKSSFDQQIATLLNSGDLRIYKVAPPNSYQPSLVSESNVFINALLQKTPQDPDNLNWLSSGDLQGRSARLGRPSFVRVTSHSQPSVILGAPPMHVDYILPDSSTNKEWAVVNFSTVPDTFNSSYTMSQTSSNQSADTNRTSYTYATTQEIGTSFSFKPPFGIDISGSVKLGAEDKNEEVSETYQFTENEFRYDASTTTGFGDVIWYDVSSFNVYYYPVLGQTVCPADNGDCDPSEEQPLFVTFSGPNSHGTGPGPGATTEWYQPVHEPGNIFSYPWNEEQLRQRISAGIDLLTGPQNFYTDDSEQTQSLQWSSGAGQDQTVGTTNSHSFEKEFSMSAGKSFGDIFGVTVEGTLNFNESTSIGTLNKSSSAVGASQGIAINKPGTFLDSPLYQYRVQPFIFGRVPGTGYVDNVSLPQDIQTAGPLQTAFAANPLDPQAGSWWGSDVSPYTQYIDVALNHPARWSKSDPAGTQETLNCLVANGSRNNCLTFNDPNPANLWNSQFYWMRGLFVTVGGVNGPQRAQATAGEEIVLQARVYNYSFKDMPAGSKIQVRFFRQEIQGTTPIGNSVAIGQVALNPLPGFNSPNSPNTPNWTIAATNLDTSGLGKSYQIFWVLVWVEDASGNMITELPGHGLSAKPGNLASIADVPLERVRVDREQKTFSNNVGYLHRKFFIAPQTPASLPSGDPELQILNAQVTPASASPGEQVIVSAEILSEMVPAEAIHVRFYPDASLWQAHQDDPARPKPQEFDEEVLPYIDVGESDIAEVPYAVQGCGRQTILIAAEISAVDEIG